MSAPSQAEKNQQLETILTKAPVVPVLIIDRVEDAVPLAKALVAGGLTALEITLRTDAALEAIKAIAGEVEDADVGAGTILTPAQYDECVEAGATFVVSPGASPKLAAHAIAGPVPFLPGVSTAGEAMTMMEAGLSYLKFFPAEQSGGAPFLKGLSSPLPQVKFCPTGGINSDNAKNYLSLPNVICVGASMVAPKDAIAAGDWDRIEALAREAANLTS